MNEPTESKSPSEWLLLLFWRQKWVLVLSLVIAAVGAFTYLRIATPLFTSTSKLLVRPASTIVLTQSQGGQSATASNFTNTQMEVIRSDAVLSLALAMLQENTQTRGKVPAKTTLLREIVDTELDRNTDIIAVTSKHPGAEESAAITKTVVDAYIKFSTSRKETSTAPEMLLRYEKELDGANRDLKTKQDELLNLEKLYGPSIRQDERNSLEQRRFDTLNSQYTSLSLEYETAKADAEAARKMLGRMSASRPAGVVDPIEQEAELGIASPQEQQALRLEILQAQSQLGELMQRYGPEHPSVKTLERRLKRLNTIYLVSIERREDTLRRQLERLKSLLDQAMADANAINAHGSKYTMVKGEMDKLRMIRDQYDAKIREIKLERDTGGVSIDVIDPAKAAEKPALPDKRKVTVIAIAMGIVLGMVLAALREWLDDRMRSANEIRSSLGMPLLAVIPQSSTKRSFSVSGQRVLLDPASDAAEAYRALRSAIQFAAPEGLRTLMISSPSSGDGKTTLTTNLGIAWAQSGKKVCIVDCDLRKPTVHDIFSLKTTLGLSTLLAGRSTLENTVQHTNVNGLDVLPCGPVPANPAEILNSQEFGATLEALADKYDIVLLDSSPVMAATDARVIAASTDATLIVLTAQSAHRRTTEQTRDALESVGARIIGLVVNDVPRKGDAGYGTPRAMRTLVPGLTSQEYDVLQVRK